MLYYAIFTVFYNQDHSDKQLDGRKLGALEFEDYNTRHVIDRWQ